MSGRHINVLLTLGWLAGSFLLASELRANSPLLLVIPGTVWIGTPLFLLSLYCLTISRVHSLHAFQQHGLIFRLFSGRLLLGIFCLVYSLLVAYAMLFWLVFLTPLEWALTILTLLAVWPVFRLFHRVFATEFKPYMAVYRALAITGWAVPAVLTGLYALLLWSLASHPGFSAQALLAVETNSPGSSEPVRSQLVQLSLNWSATFHTLKQQTFTIAGKLGVPQLLFVVLSTYALILNLAVAGSCFFIPWRELRRIIVPLSDSDEPPAAGSMAIIQTSAISVLILFFILPGLFVSVEDTVRQNPRTVATLEQARQQSAPLVERIGEQLVRPGTIAEIQALKTSAVSRLQTSEDLLSPALRSGFASLRANVDPFLDSYYSLPQEYWRLLGLLTGTMEARIEQELQETLLAGDPFASYSDSVDRLLADSDSVRQAYQAQLSELLAVRAVQTDDYVVIQSAELQSFLLPSFAEVPSLTSTGTRSGAAAVSGTVVAAIVTKISAKGTLKAAVMAVSKTLSSKLAGGAAGAASGAALGSVIPGPGTVAGAAIGIISGLAVGVSVDALLLQLEEEWSREQFRAEILAAINSQEQEMLASILGSP